MIFPSASALLCVLRYLTNVNVLTCLINTVKIANTVSGYQTDIIEHSEVNI